MTRTLTARRHAAVLSLLALLLFPLAIGTYNHLDEDCFITFRYAAQWARGRGLVYNPGERVEGYSNLLWVALAAAVERAGGGMSLAARLISLAAHGAILFAAGWAFRRPARMEDRGAAGAHWTALWAPAAIFLNPFLHYHDGRGLETVFFAALLCGAALALVARRWLAGGIILGLAALTRPEGAFYAGALAPLLAIEFNEGSDGAAAGEGAPRLAGRREFLRRAALFLAPVALAAGGQLIFRRLYYDAWVPNTAVAKLGRGRPPSGWGEILRWLIAANGLPLAGLLAAPWVWRALPGRRRLLLAAILLFLAAIVYQIAIGRVFAICYRYLIPAVLPAVLLVALMVEAAARRIERGGAPRARWVAAIFAVAMLFPAVFVPPRGAGEDPWSAGVTDAPRARFHVRLLEFLRRPDFSERWRWYLSEPVWLNAEVGRWLRATLAPRYPRAVLAADQMGQLGFFASHDQPIIDLIGLMDREIARHGLIPADLIRRSPDFLILYCRLDNGRPYLPELQILVDDPEFQNRYTIWWRLEPRDRVIHGMGAGVQFVVWGRRGPEAPAEPEVLRLGLTTEEFERRWRVL